MLLEEIRNIKANKKELRKFGFTIGIALAMIGGLLFWRDKESFRWFFYVAGAFVASGIVLPILLKPVHKVWMTFATIMGWVMTRVILSLFYFLIMTPVAMALRIAGKDFLDRKLDSSVGSYWVLRDRTPYDPKTAELQY